MSLNYSANDAGRQAWQKLKCQKVDALELVAGELITKPPAVDAVSDVGYILPTPNPATVFTISQQRNKSDFNTGYTLVPSGFLRTETRAGLHLITVSIEVSLQVGAGGYLQVYITKDGAFIPTLVAGGDIPTQGDSLSLTLSGLVKFDVGQTGIELNARYSGALGETLGVGNWHITSHRVGDV